MVIGGIAIAVAYYILPIALVWYWRTRRRRMPGDAWLRRHLLFGVFVIFCGTGHAIDVWNLWHTNYLLEGVWDCLTAAVSVWAATVLLRALREAPHKIATRDLERAGYDLAEIHDRLGKLQHRANGLDG